jgi:DNA gyrase subunit B
MRTTQVTTSDYAAKDITVLEGLEAVRKRPGMYIGSTGPADCTTSCTRWSTTPSTRRWRDGAADIEIELLADGGVRVTDDGRGIPVDEHPTLRKSALEVVLTVLHAGGKFDSKSYAVSGGSTASGSRS